ncbi:MAG TPA: helix-turn-helix transcriptional regulator [Conexibacter sp.]|jgi:transcriptional regulator with XRE-family HTH domain|nr:helix-turn-helix transcriptional regulator [Conexibacter sp.]
MRTPDPQVATFGRVIRRARRDRDMSQEALADAAGLGAKHVSEIERANRDPRLTTILKLARALGLSPGELMSLYEDQLRRP